MGSRHTKIVNSYHKRSSKQYHLEMHKENDADIIRKLETLENKQGYIKELIRRDIQGVK